jgi:hypothetical protein
MAKKLNFYYTFTPSSRTVVVDGNASRKRLLLITNVTRNEIIYNMAQPTRGASSITYNAEADETTIVLTYDTATNGHNANDVLQIFSEEDAQVFKPQEFIVDPVSKLRVSEPNTLIDTDFEYGLQSSKWESLERSNNISSFYSITGDAPISGIIDVTTTGEKEVVVSTSAAHGLTTGMPIDVRGLTSITAEGTFLVRKTTDYQFVYETSTTQPGTPSIPASLVTPYTNILTGRFYVNSAINLDNSVTNESGQIETDKGTPSILKMTTAYDHGFVEDSPFYLTNTLGNTFAEFDPASFEFDGSVEDRVGFEFDTGFFNPYEPEHDGFKTRTCLVSDINAVLNTITIPNHGLKTGDPVAFLGSTHSQVPQISAVGTGRFQIPAGNLPFYDNGSVGASNASSWLYATVVDKDTFRVCTNPQSAFDGTDSIAFNAGTGTWAANPSSTLTFSLTVKRGYDIQTDIKNIQTVNGSSEVRVELFTKSCKGLNVFPEMQITIDDCGISSLNGIYVVKEVPSTSAWSAEIYNEKDHHFVMEGPTSNVGTFVAQTATKTYTTSSVASSADVLLLRNTFERTFSPTITSVSDSTLNVSSMTLLGDGDLPTRVGSVVRFSNVGSLTGITANINYFISAVTQTSITLSSTNPSVSVTPLTLGGTVGAAAVKVFATGLEIEIHDASNSWLNHSRLSIHDWCSINSKMFTREAISPTLDRIYSKNHGLKEGTPVIFVGGGNTFTTLTGSPNLPTESATGSVIYYVSRVTNDEFELYLNAPDLADGDDEYGVWSSAGARGGRMTLSPTGTPSVQANTWCGGIYQLHPGFIVGNFSNIAAGGAGAGRDTVIAGYDKLPAYLTDESAIILKSNNGSTIVAPLIATPDTYQSYQKYFVKSPQNSIAPLYTPSGRGEFSVSLSESGSPVKFASTNATVGVGKFFAAKVFENKYSNSFYLPYHGGIEGRRTSYVVGAFAGSTDTESLLPKKAGFPRPVVEFLTDPNGIKVPRINLHYDHAGVGGANTTTLRNLTKSTGIGSVGKYLLVPVTDNIFKLSSPGTTLLPTGNPTLQLWIGTSFAKATNTVAGPLGVTQIQFKTQIRTTIPNLNSNRIVLPIQKQNFVEGDLVRYDTQGGTAIGSNFAGIPGLENGSVYSVRNVNKNTFISIGASVTRDYDIDATVFNLSKTLTSADVVIGDILQLGYNLGDEQVLVTNVSGTTITVERGYGGTTKIIVPENQTLYKVFGSFQLYAKELLPPRVFSISTAGTPAGVDAAADTYFVSTGHFLKTGDPLLMTAGGGTNPANGIALGTGINAFPLLVFAIAVSDQLFKISPTREGAYSDFTIDITATNATFIQLTESIPLKSYVSSTDPNHRLLNVSSTGSIDGPYYADSVTAKEINLKSLNNTSLTVPEREIFINPLKSVDLKDGQFIYNNHGFTTGTKIIYSKNGNTHEIGRGEQNVHPREGYNALYDIELTGITANGTTVTYSYDTTRIEAFKPGDTVDVDGVTGTETSGYNGSFKVVSCTPTSVTVSNTTTGGSPNTSNANVRGVYFAIRRSANVFQLAKTKQDALNRKGITELSTPGSVPLEQVEFNITNIARTSNVATITTASHGLTVGSTFTASIIDLQSIGFDSFDTTNVTVTVASATTFTYSNTGSNVVNTAVLGRLVVGGVNLKGHKLLSAQVFGESIGNGVSTIVARDNIINGSAPTAISAATDRLILTNHGFVTGDRVIYQVWGNGSAIAGLISGRQYFVNNTVNTFTSGPLARGGSASGQQANQFSLHNSWVGAYTNTDIVDILGIGKGTLHQIKLSNPTLKGTTFKAEWSNGDNYVYGDVVIFRGDYYMAISGNNVSFNTNQQPISDSAVYNNHWMLLPTLPSYTTKFLSQYKGNDIVRITNTIPVRSVPFAGTAVNTTTGVFAVSSHGLSTGDSVIYRVDTQGGGHAGASALANNYVGGLPQRPAAGSDLTTNNDKLIANAIYYVNVLGVNNFTLHHSLSGSWHGNSRSTTAGLYTTGIAITNIARTSNVATITTASHNLVVGQTYLATIDVTTAGQDSFDAQFVTVTANAATTVTYFNAGTNLTSQAGTGTLRIVDTTDQIVPGTAFAGTGSTHRLEKIESVVYTPTVVAINNDSEMIVTDPFPSRQIIFNPQDTVNSVTGLLTSVVNLEREEIYIPNHGLNTGTKVYYSAGFNIGFPIGGLIEGGTYFVHRVNDNVIKLCGDGNPVNSLTSLSNSLLGIARDLTSTGQGFNHFLIAATVCGSSNIRYTSSGALSADTQGTGAANAGIVGSNYYVGQVSAHIRDGVLQGLPFVYQTQAYIRSNCLNIHRPFDGGVEIQAAKNPLVSIVRQTRRYFRYQSGKGLQYSTGMSFSPSLDVSSVTHDGTTYATVTTRRPHNLSAGNKIIMEDIEVTSGSNAPYITPANGEYFTVFNVIDEFTFRYATNGIPVDLTPSGYPALFVYEWQDAYVRAGMFDDQNGMFYEYDGQELYCVRRNSTSQVGGLVSVTQGSNIITGSNTRFTKQLASNDYIVVRGMSYKVTSVESDTSIHISPTYRGTSGTRIVATKTFDLRIPQSQWSLDKCDGTGPSGFKLNIHRMQMAYMDYSWYGAGKVRFGFKGKDGMVMYVHEFVHNNHENEAYLRSGNLPARYEIETGANPTYSPSLYHWGASVIMDGKFEDDKAYLFTVASGSQGSDTISIPQTLAGVPVPILSIRLAPSVDSSIVGKLGERDLINRMILTPSSCGIVVGNTNNKPASIRLILNGSLSQSAYFTNYGAPALTQVIKHTGQSVDSISGGITIYEFRAPVNSPVQQELDKLLELGNSILGGDFVFPNGPDILTLAVVPTDTVAATTVTARLTWTESQA